MLPNEQPWEGFVLAALLRLGGEAHLPDLYREIERVHEQHRLPLSRTFKATIRRTCQQSPRIVQDIPRSGIWRIAVKPGPSGAADQ